MKTLENIKEELTEIIENRDKESAEISTIVNSLKAKIIDLKNDLLQAEKEVNIDAYDQAKRELWAAENTLELMSKKLDKLEKEPAISQEDYINYCRLIKSSADFEENLLLPELKTLFLSIERLAESSMSNINEADLLLGMVSKNICKMDSDYSKIKHPYNRTKNGSMQTYDNYNTNNSLNAFYQMFLKNNEYFNKIKNKN